MENDKKPERQLRGLYRHIPISVRSLNLMILLLCVLLAACMAYGIAHRGFHVNFDTQGGTAVESQVRLHGELLEPVETPSREGCIFDGWYLDPGLKYSWDPEQDTVTESMTLYAGWKDAETDE